MALTDIARKFGLISSSVKLKHVYINNDGGILVSEDIGKELLERFSNYKLEVKSNDEWDKSLNKSTPRSPIIPTRIKSRLVCARYRIGLTKLKELFEALEQQRVEIYIVW